MSWIVLIIICLYATLIGEFAVGYWRLPKFFPKKEDTYLGVSIIIPYRNEAENLPFLFTAIAQLEYPSDQFEVLLINDNSTDNSLELAQDFMRAYSNLSIQCLNSQRTSGSPKKDALTLGIHHAQNPWIVTTDADCTFPSSWLQTLNSFISQKKPKMIVGPVAIATTAGSSLLNTFEQLDFLSLMGATLGGFGMRMPFMCNGAHLAYEKEAFIAQGGFTSNNHIASGDDHFLLEKFAQAYPRKIHYLNTSKAIVTTMAQHSWKDLIRQRVRWASKASAYSYWFSKAVGLLVFITNCILAALLIYVPLQWLLGTYFDMAFATALPVQLILALLFKWSVDFLLIARTARFYNRKQYLIWYPILMILYPFLNVYIALKSLLASYEWKGRRFSK